MSNYNCSKLFFICLSVVGNYLLTLYMSTKVLYFANVIFQLFMLNIFLGTNYHFYGIEFIRDIIFGQTWNAASPRFPRVTLCDFEIRQMGNVHRHTVQCVLPINLFRSVLTYQSIIVSL